MTVFSPEKFLIKWKKNLLRRKTTLLKTYTDVCWRTMFGTVTLLKKSFLFVEFFPRNSESCPIREKTWSTLVSTVRWQTVYLKTRKYKTNRIRACNIISNTVVQYTILVTDKTLTFVFWKTWTPPNLITDYINLIRLSRFGLKTTSTSSGSVWLHQPHQTQSLRKPSIKVPEFSRHTDLSVCIQFSGLL